MTTGRINQLAVRARRRPEGDRRHRGRLTPTAVLRSAFPPAFRTRRGGRPCLFFHPSIPVRTVPPLCGRTWRPARLIGRGRHAGDSTGPVRLESGLSCRVLAGSPVTHCVPLGTKVGPRTACSGTRQRESSRAWPRSSSRRPQRTVTLLPLPIRPGRHPGENSTNEPPGGGTLSA